MTDDRAGVLTLAIDSQAGMVLLDKASSEEFRGLLRGTLEMYGAAIRETCTLMGQLAVGAFIDEMAETEDREADPYGVTREAARLIVAYGATRHHGADIAADDERYVHEFANLGAELFNDIVATIPSDYRLNQIVCAIATVYRTAAPWLHGEAGVEILRRVEW